MEVTITPRGAMADAWRCHDQELLVHGPSGTGKSFGLLWLAHLRALKYPGSRHLMVRKYRASLTQSGLVTYLKGIQPELYQVKYQYGAHQFLYHNGSVLVAGGLDKSSKIMSTEYDTIYCQEATELQEPEWEDMSSRCRYGVMPFQQLCADCNPSAATHWLKLRWERGSLTQIASHHEDNPKLWDAATGQWTPYGLDYIKRLDKLTGARKARLRFGVWASAEGMVYEECWDRRYNLLTPDQLYTLGIFAAEQAVA